MTLSKAEKQIVLQALNLLHLTSAEEKALKERLRSTESFIEKVRSFFKSLID